MSKKSMNLLLDRISNDKVYHFSETELAVKNIRPGSFINKTDIDKAELNYTKIVEGVPDYKVLFFRQTIGSSMILTQLHIYQGRLLYANSNFSYLGKNKSFRSLVLSEISNKYKLDVEKALVNDIIIKDIKGNRLMIVDNGRIILHYLSGDRILVANFVKQNNTHNRIDKSEMYRSVISSII